MEKQSAKIGIREYWAIALFMAGVKLADDTPAILIDKVGNAAWMVPIIAGGLVSVPLYLLIKTISLFEDRNIFTVINKLLGKYVGFLITLLIFLISSYSLAIDSRETVNIIGTMYFTTTPTLIIYSIFMFVCAYGAKKGIQHVGSVSWILIFYVLFLLFLAFVLSLNKGALDSIFPLWGNGPLNILKQSSLSLTLFSEFFLLTILMPYMTSAKDFKKGNWIAFIYIIFEISFALFVFVKLFDYPTVKYLSYPFHDMIRFISLGNYLMNIDTLFVPIWLIASFMRFSAFLYICALIFGSLFKIKDYEFLIPSLATVYLLIGMIPETPAFLTYVLRDKILLFNGPVFVALSIILWLAAVIKGEFKHAKSKNSL